MSSAVGQIEYGGYMTAPLQIKDQTTYEIAQMVLGKILDSLQNGGLEHEASITVPMYCDAPIQIIDTTSLDIAYMLLESLEKPLNGKLKLKNIPPCPNCGSTAVGPDGKHMTLNGPVQRYRCKSCKFRFTESTAQEETVDLPAVPDDPTHDAGEPAHDDQPLSMNFIGKKLTPEDADRFMAAVRTIYSEDDIWTVMDLQTVFKKQGDDIRFNNGMMIFLHKRGYIATTGEKKSYRKCWKIVHAVKTSSAGGNVEKSPSSSPKNGVKKLLYICPDCGCTEHLGALDDTFICRNCGFSSTELEKLNRK